MNKSEYKISFQTFYYATVPISEVCDMLLLWIKNEVSSGRINLNRHEPEVVIREEAYEIQSQNQGYESSLVTVKIIIRGYNQFNARAHCTCYDGGEPRINSIMDFEFQNIPDQVSIENLSECLKKYFTRTDQASLTA